MSNIPNKDMKPIKGSLSPGRRRQIPSATDEDRAKAVYPGDNSNASVGLLRRMTDDTTGPVKPSGNLHKHNYKNRYGSEEGERATTFYSNNPLLNDMFSTPEEEQLMHEEGTNPDSDSNVHELNANRTLPNKINYGLNERRHVASVLSRPYKEAEYAKKSCWQKLLDCFGLNKREKKRRGGSIGGADVTIEDLRDFLDAHPNIKQFLKDDECPLNPTEEMNNDADKFTDMLENYENQYITIDDIYNQGAGKRRKKTRKSRKTKKTKKAKRRTKRRN